MNKKSILWLSDQTLKSYAKWKNLSIDYSDLENKTHDDGVEIMIALEKLLFDFRKDIGHKNKDLDTGDILSLFLTDWNKYKSKITSANSK